ncbi:MAG: radical SAM family heme chaperone HemW [Chloroflexota bacterium]|nr:radical SAM family heme chaperone HemW [Chloroflexota bacterium]
MDGGRRGTGTQHLYIHVPFCRLVCAYCDFATIAGRANEIPRYVAALHRELAMRAVPGRLATIYFGGGTPSLVAAPMIGALIDGTVDHCGVQPDEVTLEANPSARETPDWSGLRAAGVNRISLGVQSLRNRDLVTLARGHTAEEARAAYRAARAAGFENVSIDLMYGVPGQSLDDWRANLRAAVALEPDHLSLYALQLVLEPDEWAAPPRDGALRWRRRLAARQDDDLAADQYRLAEELLAESGYRHYELSSWAAPGRESRHNAAYWRRVPYLGLGAGAHSFDGESRSWNVRSLDRYIERVEAGEPPAEGRERLDAPTRAFEAVALGMRFVSGLSRRAFSAEFGVDPIERFPAAVEAGRRAGLIELTDTSLRLSTRGRLLASEALLPFLTPAADDADGLLAAR